jgi:hypothetical protein
LPTTVTNLHRTSRHPPFRLPYLFRRFHMEVWGHEAAGRFREALGRINRG